jgi:hypothetical protein
MVRLLPEGGAGGVQRQFGAFTVTFVVQVFKVAVRVTSVATGIPVTVLPDTVPVPAVIVTAPLLTKVME